MITNVFKGLYYLMAIRFGGFKKIGILCLSLALFSCFWVLLFFVHSNIPKKDVKNKICPQKGWVSDECALIGEFPWPGGVLRIPNKIPNKFKHGSFGVSFDKESNIVSSPFFAFNWRTGEAAGAKIGAADYQRGVDVIGFSIKYNLKLVPFGTLKDVYIKKYMLGQSTKSGLIEFKKEVKNSSRYDLYYIDEKDQTVFLDCFVTPDHNSNPEKYCSGSFEIQPGIQIKYWAEPVLLYTYPDSVVIANYAEVKQSIINLINSWKEPK